MKILRLILQLIVTKLLNDLCIFLIRVEAKRKKELKKKVDQLFLFLERSWPEQKSDSANQQLTSKKRNVIPSPPPMPSNLHVICPLDIRLDTVTRYCWSLPSL